MSVSETDEKPAPLMRSLLSNRSASYHHEQKYDKALADAKEVVKLAPNWHKSHFRLGEALLGLGCFEQALEAYIQANSLASGDLGAKRDRAIVQRIEKIEIIRDDLSMGLHIHQISPSTHTELCQKSFLSPIQNMIFDFARQMRNFIYFIENVASKECFVVDACWDVDGIIKYAQKRGLKIVGAIATHYHVDHVGGIPPEPFDRYRVRVDGLAKLLKKLPSIKAYVNPADVPGITKANPEIPTDRFARTDDGGIICLPMSLNGGSGDPGHRGQISDGRTTILQFIHTPGHTPGSQCILINGKRLLSGDTLFPGSCGRVDFPDSDIDLMYNSLQEKLGSLPDDVTVFPGHDYQGDFTTIRREREVGLLKKSTRAEFRSHVM